LTIKVAIDWNDSGLLLGRAGGFPPNLLPNAPLVPSTTPRQTHESTSSPYGPEVVMADEISYLGLRSLDAAHRPPDITSAWTDANIMNQGTPSSPSYSKYLFTKIGSGEFFSNAYHRAEDVSTPTVGIYTPNGVTDPDTLYSFAIKYTGEVTSSDLTLTIRENSTVGTILTTVVLSHVAGEMNSRRDFGEHTFTTLAGTTNIHCVFSDPAAYAIDLHEFVLREGAGADLDNWFGLDPYLSNQFDVSLEPNTVYTYSWYEKDTGDDLLLTLIDGTIPYTPTQTPHVRSTDGDGWTQKGITFTTGSNVCSPVLTSLESGNYSGFYLGETSDFGAGAGHPYEDISDYILSLDWMLGKSKLDTAISYEGTATLLLDNQSKIFSPENTNSPLYGFFKKNLLVQITYNDTVMWTGWTDTWGVVPGANRTAKINCLQGHKNLRDGELRATPYEDATVSDVITELVELSGARIASVGFAQSRLSKNTILGSNAILTDTTKIFDYIGEGLRTYEFLGDSWDDQVNLEKALAELLEAEKAHLWLNRAGALELHNYTDFVPIGDNIPTINVGEDTTSAVYMYGEEPINRVEVTLKPKKTEDNVVVWRTNNAIAVPPKSTIKVGLGFTFPEGASKTVININPDADLTVWKNIRTLRKGGSFAYDAATVSENLTALILTSGAGQHVLELTSSFSRTVYVDAEVTGDYLLGDGEQTYVFDVDVWNGSYLREIESNIISTEAEAKFMAEYTLWQHSEILGGFSSIQYTDPDVDYTLGQILYLIEEQTGKSGYHAIIGEKASYTNVLVMSYLLAPLGAKLFLAEGDTVEDEVAQIPLSEITKKGVTQGQVTDDWVFDTRDRGKFYIAGVIPRPPRLHAAQLNSYLGTITPVELGDVFEVDPKQGWTRAVQHSPTTFTPPNDAMQLYPTKYYPEQTYDIGFMPTALGYGAGELGYKTRVRMGIGPIQPSLDPGVSYDIAFYFKVWDSQAPNSNLSFIFYDLFPFGVYDYENEWLIHELTTFSGRLTGRRYRMDLMMVWTNEMTPDFFYTEVEIEVMKGFGELRVAPSTTYYLTLWSNSMQSKNMEMEVYNHFGESLGVETVDFSTGRADFTFISGTDDRDIFIEIRKPDIYDLENCAWIIEDITLLTSYPSTKPAATEAKGVFL